MSEEETEGLQVKINFAEMTDIHVESKTCKCITTFLKDSEYLRCRVTPCPPHTGDTMDDIRHRVGMRRAARKVRDEFLRAINGGELPKCE